MSDSNSFGTVELKRQVTVKTIVNDDFRKRAGEELDQELKLVEGQSQQLEAQYQDTMQQLEKIAQQGQNVQKQLQQLSQEAEGKRKQLAQIKMQLSTQQANLNKASNGDFVVTGVLDNYITVGIGDNLYEKLNNAEMIVEDGVVKEIRAIGVQQPV